MFKFLAIRKDAGFGNPYYLLEATERSLELHPLPRRWIGTWMIFLMLCSAPFVTIIFSATYLIIQFYPDARVLGILASGPLLVLSGFVSYGWSQRLAWKFTKISEKSLHPKISEIKRGIFSSTITVDTEEGKMLLVVQSRKDIIARALEFAR